MHVLDKEERLIRLNEVLQFWPVSKSSWWSGVKEGRYPQPIKLGPRMAAWKMSDIQALVRNSEAGNEENFTSSTS